MFGRSLGGIGGLAVVTAVVIWARFWNKDSASNDYRESAHALVAAMPSYAANKDYLDWLVDDAHDKCFNSAYHMSAGRRSSRAWVDDDKYIHDLFEAMIHQAVSDNSRHVADALREELKAIDGAPDKPEPKKPGRKRGG